MHNIFPVLKITICKTFIDRKFQISRYHYYASLIKYCKKNVKSFNKIGFKFYTEKKIACTMYDKVWQHYQLYRIMFHIRKRTFLHTVTIFSKYFRKSMQNNDIEVKQKILNSVQCFKFLETICIIYLTYI